MGYKWDKPRKLVSLIIIAGQRLPQSLIHIVMKSVMQKQNLVNPYRVIVVYSGWLKQRGNNITTLKGIEVSSDRVWTLQFNLNKVVMLRTGINFYSKTGSQTFARKNYDYLMIPTGSVIKSKWFKVNFISHSAACDCMLRKYKGMYGDRIDRVKSE